MVKQTIKGQRGKCGERKSLKFREGMWEGHLAQTCGDRKSGKAFLRSRSLQRALKDEKLGNMT